MKAVTSRLPVRRGRGLVSSSLVLAALSLPAAAQAQPLFTITAQERSVSAMVRCRNGSPITETFMATDFNSWTGDASVNCSHAMPPGGGNSSTFIQTSTISEGSLSGALFVNISNTNSDTQARGNSVCSLTFSTTAPIRYNFTLGASAPCRTSEFIVSLTDEFSFNHPQNGQATASGILLPGSHTLALRFGENFTPSMSCNSTYTFNFGPALPEIVAGPIAGVDGCNHNRVYYQLAPSARSDAEAVAQALGGHLVTLNDAAEQAWVQSTFGAIGPANKWIGLSARLDPGTTTFRWETGELPSYTNWAPGLPVAGQGDYVLYQSDGMWIQSTDAFSGGGVGGIVEVVTPGTCRCDWNHDGGRDSNDLFAFLTDFFTVGSDFDCSGAANSADFFEFLSCFLAPTCP